VSQPFFSAGASTPGADVVGTAEHPPLKLRTAVAFRAVLVRVEMQVHDPDDNDQDYRNDDYCPHSHPRPLVITITNGAASVVVLAQGMPDKSLLTLHSD
jgi:hypothetical protein